MRISVILNPASGRAPRRDVLERALARGGVEATVVEARGPALAPAVARASDTCDGIVAAGGDGTVSTVAAAAAKAGRTMGVIPCGTLNHFARDAGIPRAIDEAVAVLAAGRTRAWPLGEINGRVFVNNASLGAYPRMLWERNRARRRGLPRPLALAVAVALTWKGLRSDTVSMVIDGHARRRRTPFIFVGNGIYDVSGTDIGRRPSLESATLWVCLAPHFGRGDALALPWRVLAGTLERHERFETATAASLVIETPRPRVTVAVDGEVAAFDAPLVFRMCPDVLTVMVP